MRNNFGENREFNDAGYSVIRKRPSTSECNLVPKAGLEPARLAPHAPQTCVSAISPLRRPNPRAVTREACLVKRRSFPDSDASRFTNDEPEGGAL